MTHAPVTGKTGRRGSLRDTHDMLDTHDTLDPKFTKRGG